MTRFPLLLGALGLVLAACTEPAGPTKGPPAGPTGSPSPAGDIAFVLRDTYPIGDRIPVRITNLSGRPYRYNTAYEACDLRYRDESGRAFIIPPGTHCDLIAIEEIDPGETVTLFKWNLDECVKDRWGCVKSEPLAPGTYTIEGFFRPAGNGSRAHASATFRIEA